ncbi:MAG TPA: hypothetical protein VMP89_03670 [Solirubrobacteraceae bacterium]|nr:hypothetical protein [Solirubrobacteraceae bacterium]
MRRARLLLLIALGVVLFVAVSGLLARVLSLDGAERSAITGLIQAEARGDAHAMSARIQDCGGNSACQARVAANAAALRRPGTVAILQLNPSAGFSLGSTVGTARVAWRAGAALPIVQCVRVRRAGNALSGQRIELQEISVRIPTGADCPARY